MFNFRILFIGRYSETTFTTTPETLKIRIIHFGVKPRGVKTPSDSSFSESKRDNEAERKTVRRRMSAPFQRVEGYSFLILFCKKWTLYRRPNRTRGASSKRILVAYDLEKEQVKETKNYIFDTSLPLSHTHTHTHTRARAPRTLSPLSPLSPPPSLSAYLLYYTGVPSTSALSLYLN